MNPEENTVVSEEVILTPEEIAAAELAKKQAEEAAAEAPAEAASEEVAA